MDYANVSFQIFVKNSTEKWQKAIRITERSDLLHSIIKHLIL